MIYALAEYSMFRVLLALTSILFSGEAFAMDATERCWEDLKRYAASNSLALSQIHASRSAFWDAKNIPDYPEAIALLKQEGYRHDLFSVRDTTDGSWPKCTYIGERSKGWPPLELFKCDNLTIGQENMPRASSIYLRSDQGFYYQARKDTRYVNSIAGCKVLGTFKRFHNLFVVFGEDTVSKWDIIDDKGDALKTIFVKLRSFYVSESFSIRPSF